MTTPPVYGQQTAASAAAPMTYLTLQTQLRSLGLADGDVVLVHGAPLSPAGSPSRGRRRRRPQLAFTWQLDRAGFEAAAVELIRRDDDVPVRLMLRAAAAEAQRLVLLPGSTGEPDLIVVLDRIAAVAALGQDLHRSPFVSMAVRTLLDVYGWAVQDLRVHASAHRLIPVLWLRIAERLYALGALSVRLQDWAAVRELTLAPVPALVMEHPRSTWHRP